MYAVFRTGGKQYRAVKGDILRLEKIEADEGASIKFDEVLLIGEGSDVKVGKPLLSGSTVSGTVIRDTKSAVTVDENSEGWGLPQALRIELTMEDDFSESGETTFATFIIFQGPTTDLGEGLMGGPNEGIL